MMDHGMGWVPSPEDARDYPLKLALGVEAPAPPATKVWTTARVPLDQGAFPHCVGFAWAGWSVCLPVAGKMTNADGHAIWADAVRFDGKDPATWKGGATCRSGLKAMKKRGRIASYFRTQSAEEARLYVLTRGPIVLGTLWWPNMSHPRNGLMTADGGKNEGGHAYIIRGSQNGRGKVRNSWGADWPDALMTWETVQCLLDIGGECWAAVEKPLGGV
jgi:hypothetical protein